VKRLDPQSSIGHPRSAILLLGPTGSGKTPLGEMLQRRGLWGRRCAHFDFGANLRRIAAGGRCAGLTPGERAVIRRALRTGALLQDDEFPIALKILQSFVARRAEPADWLVLNGLPRHAGQARGITPVARVSLVVRLLCSPATALRRIRRNVAGDRTGRTAPLLDHYAEAGVQVRCVRVGVATRVEDVWRELCASTPPRRVPEPLVASSAVAESMSRGPPREPRPAT